MQSSSWISDLALGIRNRKSHLLILHGNIYDKVLYGGREYDSLEAFIEAVSGAAFDFHLQYNLFSGPQVISGDKAELTELLSRGQNELSQEDRELMKQAGVNPDKLPREPGELFSRLDNFFRNSGKKTLFSIVYAGALFAADPTGVGSPALEALKIALKDWARDKKIRENGHTILILTRSGADLDKSLLDRELGILQIRIPKPDESARKAFLDAQEVPKEELEPLVKASAGLSFRSIGQIAEESEQSVFLNTVIGRKRRILEEEYGNVVEVLNPKWGFEAIGGLEKQKAFMRQIIANMQSGRYDLVPQGTLLTGPPGTGKTVFAEATAKEAGVNLVSPASIRSKWVGDTDKNLDEFERALVDMMPLIVWIDEFDGFVIRQGDYDGSGGVERRFLQKILQMISNTEYRGKIFWLAASNRPDLISSNLKRPGRFSFRIPFLMPNEEERGAIFQAMLNKYPEIRTNIKDWQKFAKLTEGRTGADIEALILEFAWAHANYNGSGCLREENLLWAIDDYIPQRQGADEIDNMTLAAIKECSANSFLPVGWEKVVENIYRKRGYSVGKTQALAPQDMLAVALSRSNPEGANN